MYERDTWGGYRELHMHLIKAAIVLSYDDEERKWHEVKYNIK